MKAKGNVELFITLKKKDKRRMVRQSFIANRIDASYTAICNMPLLNEVSTVLSPRYLLMKFKIDKG